MSALSSILASSEAEGGVAAEAEVEGAALEEPAAAQQGDEGADDVAVGGRVPVDGVEDGGRGDAADGCPDQAPPAAVGDQPEGYGVVAQQPGEAVGGAGGPVVAPVRAGGGCGAAGDGHAEQADALGGGPGVRFGGEVGAANDH